MMLNDEKKPENDNSEIMIFVRNEVSRRNKRKVQTEWNKTMKLYRELEQQFIDAIFKSSEDDYESIYKSYCSRYDNLCLHNVKVKRHVFTVPNRFYFVNKYKPVEIETKKSWLKRITMSITNKASKINFIEG